MKSFDQVWKELGYQYGEDALENVRLGWDLCMHTLEELLEVEHDTDEQSLAETDLYKEEMHTTVIGMSSLVGILSDKYPLGHGNYFALSGGPRIVNFWAENLKMANLTFGLNGMVKIRRYKDTNIAIILDNRIPKEWYNKSLCFTGHGMGASEAIIKDMYDVLGLPPEGMEQWTDPVSYYEKKGGKYDPKTGLITVPIVAKSRPLNVNWTVELASDLEMPVGFDKDGNWTEEGMY